VVYKAKLVSSIMLGLVTIACNGGDFPSGDHIEIQYRIRPSRELRLLVNGQETSTITIKDSDVKAYERYLSEDAPEKRGYTSCTRWNIGMPVLDWQHADPARNVESEQWHEEDFEYRERGGREAIMDVVCNQTFAHYSPHLLAATILEVLSNNFTYIVKANIANGNDDIEKALLQCEFVKEAAGFKLAFVDQEKRIDLDFLERKRKLLEKAHQRLTQANIVLLKHWSEPGSGGLTIYKN
jgi:hypothetical protein